MKLPLIQASALALLCPLVAAQEIKLLPNDGDLNDHFGYAVDTNGNIAIIGTKYDDHSGTVESGSVYVFDTASGSQISEFYPDDGADYDNFGYSVGLSGTIAIAGSPYDSLSINEIIHGSAYIFDTTTNTQIVKLVAADGASNDYFGYSVDIDGSTAIVGAPRDDGGNDLDFGSAYLFDTTTGTQIAKLLASDGAGFDLFGHSVAISGSIAVVGAYGADVNGDSDAGAVYLFDSTTGTELFKLLPTDGSSSDNFGYSVAIDGNTVLVGSRYDDDNGDGSGSAYLFNATTGAQAAKLLPSDGSTLDRFGWAVSINNPLAIVGAPYDDDNGDTSGSAYLFNTTTGALLAKYISSDGAIYDYFGSSVAIYGATPIVGAYGDDDNGSYSGSAYIPTADCNGNGILDAEEIANNPSLDCDMNGFIDECELALGQGDCNLNGIYDACEVANGTVADCNSNLIPDLCEGLPDCNSDGVPDECETDCNSNGTPDVCESLPDCNADGTPDECQSLDDCDSDGEPDFCEIAGGSETDLNANGVPDSCECSASNYCTASPNTAGSGVLISTTGISSIALNSLGLDAAGGPSNQPGLFFHGPGTASQPFGEGIRCVSTPIIRVGPPVFFNGAGTTSKQLDMNATALSNIQPADTRYFQLWYRDTQGGPFGFNLSNGLEITFCP